MIDISQERDICFLIMRKVHNQPGVGKAAIDALKEAGVVVESFQGISTPRSINADVIMLGIHEKDTEKVSKSIMKATDKAGGQFPFFIRNLVGIIIREFPLKDPTEVIHRILSVCEKLRINILIMTTTYKSLSFYVKAEDFRDELIEDLQKAFA
ncbi:unnamed protein product [marine sediment metagenome]|uniref:ACT domain-containing protein n=1 Tax=marine sediment metagenome TaxID=412755 RepID=X0X8Y2_9ZZZZ